VVECRAPAEELEQAERLVRQGDRYLAQGNIAIARQYFARAADLGLAIAALKIAETYDPNELARPNVYGVKPNPAEARRWYQRAFELNLPEAEARVQRLGTR
jgi:TPR repeat protein